MARPIRLFVSSSPDLAPEREALGQAVAELPVSVGWEIKHTPRPGEKAFEPLTFIERCDLYLVVLGADFAAPMGAEWQQARGAGKALLAYRKRVLYSPSAQTLLHRSSDVTWTEFQSPQELKAQVTRALAQALLDRGEQFGLHLDEVEALLALIGTEEEEGAFAEPDQRRGAGRGAVILGRGT
ncbi:MAG: hypothetical protein DRI79_00375 [Chloroflexi bacterium]|nr:MAG: hypothetical protein DRI80_07825 [Chloroflexota bacterium]RLC92473.1 MAG: hypothetical protein DRI79_00375 [Chloroflexota bacterium]HEY66970.1 DUF4062 domain-containing protein [Thermoflexia bacterium]